MGGSGRRKTHVDTQHQHVEYIYVYMYISYSDMTYAWFDVTRNAVTVSDYLHVT